MRIFVFIIWKHKKERKWHKTCLVFISPIFLRGGKKMNFCKTYFPFPQYIHKIEWNIRELITRVLSLVFGWSGTWKEPKFIQVEPQNFKIPVTQFILFLNFLIFLVYLLLCVSSKHWSSIESLCFESLDIGMIYRALYAN